MTFTVAIIGRPNVGKSTLFNRLIGKRLAIVDDQPGVTRDRREGEGRISDMRFNVIDTAGLEEADENALETRMRKQTERAMDEADVALMLIDARAGVTPMDEHFAGWLRQRNAPVLLVANKCEGKAAQAGLMESYGLGLGEPIGISAEHGEGMADLYEALLPFEEAAKARAEAAAYGADPELEAQAETDLDLTPTDEDVDEDDGRAIQLAIVGRPNVGKSTLVNRLLGEDRMLTGPEAGITRDSILSRWEHQGREVRLVDTAGLRKKARVSAKVENLSAAESIRAIKFAQVVCLVLDAQEGLEKQDLTIARRIIDEGRAMVIAINKWDAVDDRREALQAVADRMETSLHQLRGVPVVCFSALTGRGVEKLMPAVFKVYKTWNRRIATSKLNRWLGFALDDHPPPMVAGRRLKIRYMTQAKCRPPTFALFSTRADKIPDAYTRYLVNGIRDTFEMQGVPIRMHLRQGKNPYDDKDK